MSLSRFVFILIILSLLSCESPPEKISRLQRETLNVFGAGDYFEVKSKTMTVRLPLPPEPSQAESWASRISEINLEAYSFDNERLSAEDQKRLQELNSQLSEIEQRGKGAFFDPNTCVLTEVLTENTDPKFSSLMLQKIPLYYAEVERRWQIPSRIQAQNAAKKSLQVLDLLDKMGDQSYLARLAVKDFIALCLSTNAEH